MLHRLVVYLKRLWAHNVTSTPQPTSVEIPSDSGDTRSSDSRAVGEVSSDSGDTRSREKRAEVAVAFILHSARNNTNDTEHAATLDTMCQMRGEQLTQALISALYYLPWMEETAIKALAQIDSRRVIDLSITTLGEGDRRTLNKLIHLLAAVGSEYAIERVRSFLRSPDVDKRQAVIELIGLWRGEWIMQELSTALYDLDEHVRFAAVMALERIGGEQAAAILAEGLHDADLDDQVTAAQALARLGDARGLARLTEVLAVPDDQLRRRAARTLVSLKTDQTRTLLLESLAGHDVQMRLVILELLHEEDATWASEAIARLLRDPVADVRQKAIDLLGQLHAQHAVVPLIGALDDSEMAVRQAAVEALGTLGSAQAVVPLIGALSDPEMAVRQAVVEALGALGSAQAVVPLINALDDSEMAVRQAVVEALGALGSAQAVVPLIGALGNLESTEQRNVLRALGRIGGDQALEIILAALTNPSWQTRLAAVQALRDSSDQRIIQPLISALIDPSRSVRHMAALVLAKILDNLEALRIAAQHVHGPDPRVREAIDWAAAIATRPADIATRPMVEYFFDSEERERVVNAWVEGLASDAPLALNQRYVLAFNVNQPREDARATVPGIAQLLGDRPEAEILVMLVSDDFALDAEEQVIIMPRKGPSDTVQFGIRPSQAGLCVITALLTVNNRLFQRVKLSFAVEQIADDQPPSAIERSGQSLTYALRSDAPQEQIVTLAIIKRTINYQFILHSVGVTRATIDLSETQLAELSSYARKVLRTIVYTEHAGEFVYQLEDTVIPPEVYAASLPVLAELGYYLYQGLFYAPGNGHDAHSMGEALRHLSHQGQLRIRIVAERFVFPWALLYDRDLLDADAIDPTALWGFKHVIEYAPEFSCPTLSNFSSELLIRHSFSLDFVLNTTIDTDLKCAVIQGQRAFLQEQPDVVLSEHPNRQDLYDLLNSGTNGDVIYCYCHAQSYLPGEQGGVDQSKLILSDGAVQLRDLKIRAPIGRRLAQAPLVFLNACQSAELSPYLYDGLVPYLIAKGARGVLGTEVDTPAFFAAEFARIFLAQFISGRQPLGKLLRDLRRAYLLDKNNIMGLVYALYSSADLIVRWPEM